MAQNFFKMVEKLFGRKKRKLKQRQRDSFRTTEKTTLKQRQELSPTTSLQVERQRLERLKRGREKQAQFAQYQESYNEYKEAFDEYKKEKDEFISSVEDWEDEGERSAEKEGYNQALANLKAKTSRLLSTSKATFGTNESFKQLQTFDKAVSDEGEQLNKVEQETKEADETAAQRLSKFKYYEGKGFLSGDVAALPGTVVGATGVAPKFQTTGTFEKYTPETGTIETFEAQPQSERLTVGARYQGTTYTAEDLDDLGLTQQSEVVGQNFDFSKYENNPKYTITRDAQGKVTRIEAKPRQYPRFKNRKTTQWGTFVPETVTVKNGRVTSIVKRDWYNTSGGRNVNGRLFNSEELSYDTNGLLTGRTRAKDRGRKVVLVNREKWKDGVKTGELLQTYDNRGKLLLKKDRDFLRGTEQIKSRDRQQFGTTGKVTLPTGEAQENIRKFGAYKNLALTQTYATAKPGEKVRTITTTVTTPSGVSRSVRRQAYSAPKKVKEEKVLFGTRQKALSTLRNVQFKEKSLPFAAQQRRELFGRFPRRPKSERLERFPKRRRGSRFF